MNIRHFLFNKRRKDQSEVGQAIRRAYACFAELYPGWAASCFDQHFLDNAAAEVMKDPFAVDPLDLARAWASQFGTSQAAQRRSQRRVLPAATHFVRLLQVEMTAVPLEATFHIRVA